MGVEGKRLLVLGAGRGQIGLYKAAKEMGITTIAGTMPDNNPQEFLWQMKCAL